MCAVGRHFLVFVIQQKKMGGNCDSMGPNSGNRNSVSCTHLVDVGEDRRALKNATHTHTYTHHVSLGQSWTIEINVWKSNTFCKRPFAYKPAGERKKKKEDHASLCWIYVEMKVTFQSWANIRGLCKANARCFAYSPPFSDPGVIMLKGPAMSVNLQVKGWNWD